MGEVYRAADTRIDRIVAIKISKEQFSDRFEREARAIATLNHPHICQLYDVGPNYLVMEFVEGRTLSDRIQLGAIPLDEALAIAQQIADALDASHQKGIVHRDLKPTNIKLSDDGMVKVLDFGLAKVVREVPPSGDPSDSPTVTLAATRAGTILGTAAYMAPEQVRGKVVDKRVDIWAFGVVLYEMLTGLPLFRGEDVGETLAAVLKQEPDFIHVPRRVHKLLQACLEKQPDRRLRDISDARLLLADDSSPPKPSHGAANVLWPAVAAFAAAAFGVVSWLHFREATPVPAEPLRFQIAPPQDTPTALLSLLNISPDGRKLAFLSGGRLRVHFLESGETRDLTDAGGTPFWSPDSRFIAYAAAGSKLMRIEATGGVPRTLAEYRGAWGGGAWNQSDVIVFSNRNALFRVAAAGGVPVQLTTVDVAKQETTHYAPHFLPGGRHFIYTRRSRDDRNSVVLIGAIDGKAGDQSSKPLVNTVWGAQYAPSEDPNVGYLLFIRESTLMAAPMDPRRFELKGQAVPVAEHMDDGRAFSVSGNGVLVFHQEVLNTRLTWFDRDQKTAGTVGDPDSFRAISLSPDGSRAIIASGKLGQPSNLWLLDLSGGSRTRLGLSSASEGAPVWSRDGDRVLFSSNRNGAAFDLYQQKVNGVGSAELLYKSAQDKIPTSCSRDGRFLLYTVISPQTGSDIWALPLEGTRKPLLFLGTEADEGAAHFSPDGHWVAYTSNESGRNEVYVRSFSVDSAMTAVESSEKRMISQGGGTSPRWRGDGSELYYVRPADHMLVAVDIVSKPAFRVGQPRSSGVKFLPDSAPVWDATADGKRFLAAVFPETKTEPYTVVLNWQAVLKK
jgi:Tol biopolymer transport system component